MQLDTTKDEATDPGGAPSPNGSNGQRANGRFAKGNPGGPGNPYAKRTAAIRGLLLDAVTDDDLRAVIAKLVAMARGGDLAAIQALFDRLFGKAVTPIAADIESIDETLGPHVRIIEDSGWYNNSDRAFAAASGTVDENRNGAKS